jgi:hypothetical protein
MQCSLHNKWSRLFGGFLARKQKGRDSGVGSNTTDGIGNRKTADFADVAGPTSKHHRILTV